METCLCANVEPADDLAYFRGLPTNILLDLHSGAMDHGRDYDAEEAETLRRKEAGEPVRPAVVLLRIAVSVTDDDKSAAHIILLERKQEAFDVLDRFDIPMTETASAWDRERRHLQVTAQVMNDRVMEHRAALMDHLNPWMFPDSLEASHP